ncbi:MAG: hypothetical protein IT238_06115 [Bacteroidia bacterium]|nr:hypothetical protein [Bacteroidia bacterium]
MKKMNKLSIKLLSLSFILISTITSCKKDGVGGKNTIEAFPKHHGKSIPNAVVYIKYGATELPGTNASDYDDKEVATQDGNLSKATFNNLLKGNYYLYSVGYDTTINEMVYGGIAVTITTKSGSQEVDVPVTE